MGLVMRMEIRTIWIRNVRAAMRRAGVSLSEAAGALGTSKQYLSQLLDPDRDPSTRELIMDNLAWLLQTTPSSLFSPEAQDQPSPAIPAVVRRDAVSFLPANGEELLRRIQMLDDGRDYEAMTITCERAGAPMADALSPGERADLDYYWGKALINLQQPKSGEERIRSALRLFQQRQTHQPGIYASKIASCYRYLALAAYFGRQFEASIRHNRMVMTKWRDYPALINRNEALNAATNMLRAAKRGGLYRQIPGLEAEILEFGHRNALPELSGRLLLERFGDEAEVADVYQLEPKPSPRFDDRQSTELSYISQGTYLLVKERWAELSLHINKAAEPGNPLIALHLYYWQGRLSIAAGSPGDQLQGALDELQRIRAMGNVPSRIEVHLDALRAFRQAEAGETELAVHYWLNAIAGARAMQFTGLALELANKMMRQLAGRLSDRQMQLLMFLYEKEKAEYSHYILRGEQLDDRVR